LSAWQRLKFQVFAASVRSPSFSGLLTRLGRRSRDFLSTPDPSPGTLETWAGLGDLDDAPRYGVIAAYLRRLVPDGSILDVGCAQGVLAAEVAHLTHRYLGIERDAACVGAARQLGLNNAEFRVADASNFAPDEAFDAIVFNESLYYLPDPLAALARYAKTLTPQGVLIVSATAYRPALRLISAIRESYSLLEQTTVSNEAGVTWVVMALKPITALIS